MSAPDRQPRSLLALDFGGRRIGLATGSLLTGTASALTTINAVDGNPHWPALDKVVTEWRPDILIVGLPYNADGSESGMTARTRAFAAELEQRYKLPVSMVDERYTSAEAHAILKDQRRQGVRNKKLRKEDVDATAAQLIAESWLRTSDAPPLA